MARTKHANKALQRAVSPYEKLCAARYGALAGSGALAIASKLKMLAQLQVWHKHAPDKFAGHGGLNELNRLAQECCRQAEIWFRGSIRPDPDNRGRLVYDPGKLEHLAACIRVMGQRVQPIHETVNFIHRESNTVARTAQLAADILKREDTPDFRRSVRRALDELGLPYAKRHAR